MSDCPFVKRWLACLPSHWHDDFRASFKEAQAAETARLKAENTELLEFKSRVQSEIRNTDDARAKLFAAEERVKRLKAELARKDEALREFVAQFECAMVNAPATALVMELRYAFEVVKAALSAEDDAR